MDQITQEQVEPITVEPQEPVEPVTVESEPGDVVEPEANEPEAKVSREQKYRRKLRETEAERDTLRTALTEARRSIVNKHIGESEELFWRINHDLTPDDFFTADNELNANALSVAVGEVQRLAPAIRNPLPVPELGGSGYTRHPRSFADAFRPQK